jgi:hypothetical protein
MHPIFRFKMQYRYDKIEIKRYHFQFGSTMLVVVMMMMVHVVLCLLVLMVPPGFACTTTSNTLQVLA